ncbi:MAG: PEP-CTERM sorting domain-containing protein [Sedimentisphaerales bacterium]
MKKSVITYAVVLLVCLGLVSSAEATIVTGSQEWYKNFDANESVTCIAFYGLGSVEFTQPPEWLVNGYTPPYNHDIVGWETALSADNKIAYLYGPRATNSSGYPREWFAYELFYQWDTSAEGFDPCYPVYQDMAIFDGPFGSEPIFAVGWRGTPGDASSWEYKDNNPYGGPYQTDEPYTNPVPEPMMICLLGLGAAFLRKSRRRSKAMATE